MRRGKPRRRRATRQESGPDDATTNPAYAVKITPSGRAVPTQAAIDAADQWAKQSHERRNGS